MKETEIIFFFGPKNNWRKNFRRKNSENIERISTRNERIRLS